MRLASARSDHAALIILSLGLGLAACTKSTPPDGAILPPVAVPIASVTAVPSAAPVSPPAETGVVVDLSDDGKVTIDGAEVALDAVRDAFTKKPREDVAVFRAGPDIEWKRIVHLLDLMKQAGNRDFALAIRNDPSRRTARISFPKAGSAMAPPPAPPPAGGPVDFVMDRSVSVMVDSDGKMTIDGSPLAGPLKERLHAAIARSEGDSKPRIIVHGDAKAPFGTIIDIALAAQAENAMIAFAVSVDSAPPARAVVPSSAPDTTKPRPKPKAFDACPFPAEADKAGIDTAAATLRVKVDATGKVTDVTVVNDPGHGFGAAAKTCAQKAAFDPAKDPSGHAVAGEAVIRVRFVR